MTKKKKTLIGDYEVNNGTARGDRQAYTITLKHDKQLDLIKFIDKKGTSEAILEGLRLAKEKDEKSDLVDSNAVNSNEKLHVFTTEELLMFVEKIKQSNPVIMASPEESTRVLQPSQHSEITPKPLDAEEDKNFEKGLI